MGCTSGATVAFCSRVHFLLFHVFVFLLGFFFCLFRFRFLLFLLLLFSFLFFVSSSADGGENGGIGSGSAAFYARSPFFSSPPFLFFISSRFLLIYKEWQFHPFDDTIAQAWIPRALEPSSPSHPFLFASSVPAARCHQCTNGLHHSTEVGRTTLIVKEKKKNQRTSNLDSNHFTKM